MKMAGTYVQLSRQEFEDWLDTLGFRGKWRLKPGRGGIYQIPLSDTVAIEINSTTGSGSSVMNRGRASMKLKLVSRITGRTLNKKSMGQSHFKRTVNWRDTWKKGVERMKSAYMKSKSFYDALAAIEDRDQYMRDMLDLIESQSGWDSNDFLRDLHKKVQNGGILTEKQKDAITRSRPSRDRQEPADEASYDEGLVARMRQLWVAAKRRGDDWTMDFVQSVAEQVKGGRSLSRRQKEVLEDKFQQFRVASVQIGTVRVAAQWLDSKMGSTGAECYFFKATNGKWYMELEDTFTEEFTTYGPFGSFKKAERYLEQNFANPGGYSVDDSGTERVPRDVVKPGRSRRMWAFNKYNPNELLSQLVEILEKYELEDAVKEVKRLTPKVQQAWRSRER